MKKRLLILFLMVFVFCGVNTASASTMAYWSITHSCPADLVITIGAGDTTTPLWSSVVQDHEWNYSDTVDISAGESYLYGNTWWVRMADEWSWDSGTITSFSITDNFGTIFTSTDTPVYIPDLSTRYAFIDIPPSASPAPEPSTIFLMGFGIIGAAAFARKRLKK